MSHEDGDISMSSYKEESFNMSVQHDAIEVVWASTQSPVITSILEESKLNKLKNQSTGQRRDESSFLFDGPASTPTLFRDATTKRAKLVIGNEEPAISVPSVSQSRPFINRSSSTPISAETQRRHPTASQSSYHPPVDPRKVRPSQRQSLLQSSHLESAISTENGPSESLEALREMIQGVSQRWNRAGAQSPSTSSSIIPRPVAKSESRVGSSTKPASDSLTQLQIPDPQKKPKTRILSRNSDQQKRAPDGSDESGRLMLPPAIPLLKNANTRSAAIDQKAGAGDMSFVLEGVDRQFSQPGIPEPVSPSPKERLRLQSETSLYQNTIPSSNSLRNSRSNSSLAAKPPTIASAQPAPAVLARPVASSASNGGIKAPGMRRTASGNRFEPSGQKPSEDIKSTLSIPSSSQPSSHSQPLSQNNIAHEPNQSKPRSFQVPWARQSPQAIVQTIAGSQSPTGLNISSPASQSGSDSARTLNDNEKTGAAPDANQSVAMDWDDSYSFDDFSMDAEELHKVLSQCGA